MANWYRELRPAFLTAALVPVTAPPLLSPNKGSAVGLLLLTLLAGLLIHGGANAINDYFDHKSGNDEANREFVRSQRRSRLIQLGLLTDRGTGIAMFCFIVSSAIGTTWRLPRPLILVLGMIGCCPVSFTPAAVLLGQARFRRASGGPELTADGPGRLLCPDPEL